MAIDYDLGVATRLSALDVATRLSELGGKTGVLDASFTPEALLDKELFLYTSLGTGIRVLREDPPRPWNLVAFGFALSVSVAFRIGKGVEVSDQQDQIIRLVAPLLEQVDGAAVLHFQYEVVRLLHRNGELSLNERDDLWRPRRLALMTRPYRRETHSMDID
jgi:hypothetical protein